MISNMMAELLCTYRNLGILDAKINWIRCRDINGISSEINRRKDGKRDIINQLMKLEGNLKVFLSETELVELKGECDEARSMIRERQEVAIEAEFRPPHVFFNDKALVILTETVIPFDIQLGLSFGPKFLFPYACNDDNMHETLAQLEMTIEGAISESQQQLISKEIAMILRERSHFEENKEKQWLMFVNRRTTKFLNDNKHISATKSDKGGHTVILNVSDYAIKLEEMLSDDCYGELNDSPLEVLINQESAFINRFKKDREIDKILKILPPYEPNTLHLSKFYGLVKIHKRNSPLRPITAMIGSVGYLLSKVFNEMLKAIFPRTKYHIKDTYEFVEFINRIKIGVDERLLSFDVVSMYTSIPIELVKEIILGRSNKFLDLFSLNRADLEAIMNFLLQECTAFTALGKIFKQLKGLPMGSCISPTLARITMDVMIRNLKIKVPQISFIRVFVDDTIVAMKPEFIDEALKCLNDFRPNQIRFTKEHERADGSIDFLNVTLRRHMNRILTNWYKKYYASGRLLNYFSSHKRSIILGTATHFIKTVLQLSDPSSFWPNRCLIEQILRENSFPESLIIVLLRKHYTYMTPFYSTNNKKETRIPHNFYPNRKLKGNLKEIINEPVEKEIAKKYVIFPHSICNAKDIKRVLYANKMPDKVLADSVKNTKLNSVKTIKTKIPTIRRKNLILMAACKCGRKTRIIATKFNETAGMAMKRIITKNRICMGNSHSYSKVTFKKGLCYSNQTNTLLKYIQWKHRKTLDGSHEFEFPNYYLSKLV